jgi:hypothetical protein
MATATEPSFRLADIIVVLVVVVVMDVVHTYICLYYSSLPSESTHSVAQQVILLCQVTLATESGDNNVTDPYGALDMLICMYVNRGTVCLPTTIQIRIM